jgi:hypothetical protein
MRYWITIALLLAGWNLALVWAADEVPAEAAAAPVYELETRIEITGLNLLPVEPDGEPSAQDATNWLVRLIDPTESLDHTMLPDSMTTASYHGVLDSPERIVAVLFDVPVDLAGGGAASTPVDVLIPVELDSAEATELDAKVNLSQTDSAEWVVDLDYQVKRGGRRRRQHCRLYWGSGLLVFDEDGDGVYETVAGEPDSDRNCLGGEQRWRRQGPRDGHGQGQGNGSGPRDGRGRRQGGNGKGNGGRQAGG